MGAIEKTNATPLYLQLKNKIKKEIRTGMLKPGDKLPSETQLQKEYNMSRVTVRKDILSRYREREVLWLIRTCCVCR